MAAGFSACSAFSMVSSMEQFQHSVASNISFPGSVSALYNWCPLRVRFPPMLGYQLVSGFWLEV